MSRTTIARFYGAFAKLDAQTMERCYAEQAHFQDEVFTLQGWTPFLRRKVRARAAAQMGKYLAR